MIGIYKITNITNGKCYIGQSVNITQRWKYEKYSAFNVARPEYAYPISIAFRKYGVDNFTFEVIEECQQSELNSREQYWASYYNSYIPNGYNLAYCGSNGNISGNTLNIEQVYQIIDLLKTTSLTQEQIGKQFNVNGKTIQRINTGVHWRILDDTDYPIRERYFRTNTQADVSALVCDNEVLNLLIEVALHGFAATSRKLNIPVSAIKRQLENNGLPVLKQDIANYYITYLKDNSSKTTDTKLKTKILQIDPVDNTILNIFNSGYEAGRYLGDENKRKHINEVCLGKRATAYGYIWRRVDESNEG